MPTRAGGSARAWATRPAARASRFSWPGEEAAEWLARAAERYRESFAEAPPGSWGRPIGAIKARLLAGDADGAEDEARWALEEGAAGAESPIGRYAACLALLVLGRDAETRP